MNSAVDTLTTRSSAAAPPGTPKRHAVAHGAPVDVTGAKQGLDAGKRELFAESTSSVLVFENGGVIRLAADVAPGQLLFLTHTATKREVVAQVTRKHALASGYVEVEFTEPAPRFWGVDFPSEPQAVQIERVESAPAAALRQALEKADQETPATRDWPNAAEVERLKGEVEALRGQLASIQRQPVAAPSQADGPLSTSPWVAKKAEPETRETAELAKGMTKASEGVASSEPAEATPEFALDLLPKAALDFSRADAANSLAPKAQVGAQNGSSTGKLRLLLLAGLLLAMVGGALYQGWIRGLAHPKPQPAVATPIQPAAARPGAGNAQKPGATAGALTVPLANRSDRADHARLAETAPTGDAPVERAAEKDSEAEAEPENTRATGGERAAAPAPRAAMRPGKAAPAAEKIGKKKTDADDDFAAASQNEHGVVPPKLVHSVRAVTPPEAVRQFATGNVILDAVVDSTGHVKSSKVLSGPRSLRNAAAAALKQYQYTPAKRHGKAVPAHVQVTVQFWYEP